MNFVCALVLHFLFSQIFLLFSSPRKLFSLEKRNYETLYFNYTRQTIHLRSVMALNQIVADYYAILSSTLFYLMEVTISFKFRVFMYSEGFCFHVFWVVIISQSSSFLHSCFSKLTHYPPTAKLAKTILASSIVSQRALTTAHACTGNDCLYSIKQSGQGKLQVVYTHTRTQLAK